MTSDSAASGTSPDQALVVVDALNDFLSRRGKGWPMLREVATEVDVVAHLQLAVTTARGRGMTVVHAPHRTGRGTTYRHPTPNQELSRITRFFDGFGGRFFAALQPLQGDVIASPHSVSSAFGGTDLDRRLTQLGVEEIVVCGLLTNTCIESTARHGVDRGYHVTVLADATAAWTRADHDAAVHGSLPQTVHRVISTADFAS